MSNHQIFQGKGYLIAAKRVFCGFFEKFLRGFFFLGFFEFFFVMVYSDSDDCWITLYDC
jgi:hypothetical protein